MNLASYLYLVLVVSVSDAYKILVMFHIPGKSHINLGDGLVRELVDAGHEVTYFTPFPKENPPQNLHQIDISSPQATYGYAFEKFLNNDYSEGSISNIMRLSSDFGKKMILHENVQKFLNDSSQEFDVVIVEWLLSELLSGFSAIYDCPLIWLHPMDPFWLILSLVDEYTNPAYTTSVVSYEFPPLNFLQRISELWFQLYIKLYTDFITYQNENKAYKDLLAPHIAKQGRPVPSFNQVKYSASLILGNSDPSLGMPIKLPPNYKPVGGYHINRNITPLPENLQHIMDNAKNGVIYFSLGTNVKSKDMPESIKNGILKVFGELNQTVLWKYEKPMPDAPKNVHVLQWAPQPSILDHPNCILFITHCGLLSTTEAVHFGVPLIGIPVFVDQFLNIESVVKRGIGRRVNLSYNMAQDMREAIHEVLRNSSYSKQAKHWSMVFHDRPVPPGKELVHWVEHVVRTRGAPHLRSSALMVPWYQKMYLDLIVVLFLIYLGVKHVVNIIPRTNIKIKML